MINLIWAQSTNGVIGRDGGLPWHLPEDMAHFAKLTTGHTVVMGRATWQSLPERARPLPNRRNIVLTRTPGYEASGAEVAGSLSEALNETTGQVWVIGGAQVFDDALPLADRLVVTEVDTEVDGDVVAPQIPAAWTVETTEPADGWLTSSTGLAYRFCTYVPPSHPPPTGPEQNVGEQWKNSRVGYFRDPAGHAQFLEAYRAGMQRLPEPEQTWDVPTTFGSVRVYRFGTSGGAPLALLSGRHASTPMWAANLPSLLEHRDVYAIDLLGEPGLSVQTRPISDAADHAQWLDEALAGLDLEHRVHLLGVSIGGWAAANAAIRRPDRIASISLLDPVMTFTRLSPKMLLGSLAATIPIAPARWRRAFLSWMSGGTSGASDLPEGRLIAAGMRAYVVRLPVPAYPSSAQLRSITVPALVLLAGRSVVHSPSRAEARARVHLPHADVEVWGAASHAINGEYPEEIARRVAAFTETATRTKGTQ